MSESEITPKQKTKAKDLDKREWMLFRETLKTFTIVIFTILLTLGIVDELKKDTEHAKEFNELKQDIKNLDSSIKEIKCVHKDTTIINNNILKVKR